MLIAHRGFRLGDGENCLFHFARALETCLAVEFDLRFTADQKLIIFHDASFKRMAHVRKLVKKLTYEAIKNLPFYQEHPSQLPPLFVEEFIPQLACKYQLVNVELKADRYTPQQLEQIKQALTTLSKQTKAEIIVSSFSPKLLRFIATLDHQLFKRGYLFQKPRHVDRQLVQQFDYLHPGLWTVENPRYDHFFEQVTLPMNVWTFTNDEQVEQVKALYGDRVVGYISDNPFLKTA